VGCGQVRATPKYTCTRTWREVRDGAGAAVVDDVLRVVQDLGQAKVGELGWLGWAGGGQLDSVGRLRRHDQTHAPPKHAAQ
jgi:hypothetical protein